MYYLMIKKIKIIYLITLIKLDLNIFFLIISEKNLKSFI